MGGAPALLLAVTHFDPQRSQYKRGKEEQPSGKYQRRKRRRSNKAAESLLERLLVWEELSMLVNDLQFDIHLQSGTSSGLFSLQKRWKTIILETLES